MYQIQICSLILLCLVYYSSWATDWFKNTDQQAQTAFEQKDYAKSAQLFTDPYQRGVALYRNGQYTEAVEAFTAVTNPETRLNAQYNLGNTYLQQGDYQKAVAAYEQVLAERPTDEDAKHNLALAKQLLKSQQQNSSTNESEKDTAQQGKQSAQSPSQKAELPKSQANAQNEQQSVDKTKPQDKQLENNNPSEIAEQPPTEEKATSTVSSTDTLPNEEEVMAEVLLNRLEENPQRLLRNQFYLDAQRTEAPPPTQPW